MKLSNIFAVSIILILSILVVIAAPTWLAVTIGVIIYIVSLVLTSSILREGYPSSKKFMIWWASLFGMNILAFIIISYYNILTFSIFLIMSFAPIYFTIKFVEKIDFNTKEYLETLKR